MNIALVFQNYLPELIGSLFVADALFFFGKHDKLEKNNLVFASIAFLLLSLKDFLSVFVLSGELNSLLGTVDANFLTAVSVALIAAASMLMIVGGFSYSKAFSWIKYPLVVFFCSLLWFFITYIALLPFGWADFLSTVYLSFGMGILGLFFCLARFNSKAYNLRVPGFFFFFLASYYFQSAMTKDYTSWITESVLYALIVWGIYRTTMRQLRRDTKDLASELKIAYAKIPMIIQSSPFPILISALKDDRLLLVNEKASSLFNINMENIKQFRLEEYFVDPNARRELLQKLSIYPTVENFQALLRKPGTSESFWLEISARVMDYENEVVLYSAFKDITAQKKHEQALFEKAVLDPLTGCYNRRQFQELAMKEVRMSWRYNTKFCLMMMDIDHFKRVNDTHGHAFGDEVLKTMAKVCKKTLRECDIFARYGGEEFVVLLTQTDLAGGKIVAERIRQNIEKTNIPLPSGDMFHFSVSIGVVSSATSDDLDELIKRADSALYTAKENGRNQVRLYGEKESFEELKKQTLKETDDTQSISEKIIETANVKNTQGGSS